MYVYRKLLTLAWEIRQYFQYNTHVSLQCYIKVHIYIALVLSVCVICGFSQKPSLYYFPEKCEFR